MTATDCRMPNHRLRHSPRRERGAVLLVSLVILTVLTILGMSAIDSSGLQTRMANNQKERVLAMQAAEAALREAEVFIESGGIPTEDLATLPKSCADTGVCFEGSGALTPASCTSVPPLDTPGVGNPGSNLDHLPQELRADVDPLGVYDPAKGEKRQEVPLGALGGEIAFASYIIKFNCYVPGTPGDLVTVDPHQLYVITAYAETKSGRGRVMLKSTYKKRP